MHTHLPPLHAPTSTYRTCSLFPGFPHAVVLEAGDVTLEQLLKDCGSRRLPDNQARFIFESVAQALKHMHDSGVAHLDLKAANIMRFYDGTFRLIDLDQVRVRVRVHVFMHACVGG